MDQAAEPIPAQDAHACHFRGRVHASGGRVLLQRPARPMDVVVIGMLERGTYRSGVHFMVGADLARPGHRPFRAPLSDCRRPQFPPAGRIVRGPAPARKPRTCRRQSSQEWGQRPPGRISKYDASTEARLRSDCTGVARVHAVQCASQPGCRLAHCTVSIPSGAIARVRCSSRRAEGNDGACIVDVGRSRSCAGG
jgi:hypothetical protein